jgi:hypothetical protein
MTVPRTWEEWTCHTHMRVLWTIIGVYTVLWGCWLESPWWDVFSTAPLYRELADFMPEWLWGLNAILAGSIMLIGSWLNSWKALAWGAGAGVYHWGTIAALYFAGDWHNTGGITSLCIALMIVVTWRVSCYCDKLYDGLTHVQYDERDIIHAGTNGFGESLHVPPAEGRPGGEVHIDPEDGEVIR